VPRHGSSFRRAVELIDRRWLDLDSLVTLRVPLSEAVRGFAALVDRSGIKVVVEPAKPGSAGRAIEDRPS